MKVLVTGGCGYIGAHTLADLLENGHEVVNIDSNARSNTDLLQGVEQLFNRPIPSYRIDLCDKNAVKNVFLEHPEIEGIIHFAAFKTVPESVEKPLMYYRNNLLSLINLLELVEEFKIPHFVFSSSCSVYGNTTDLPVTEATLRQNAESPYGNTKKIGEDIIEDLSKTSNSDFISLRYFNPIGAHPSALLGEIPYGKPQNLQPIIIETAKGQRNKLSVFGYDYPTRDGTCIRDYIHVCDVAHAHTLALTYLQKKQNTYNYEIFNIGSGNGVSVLEMIEAFETTTKQKLNYELVDRRPGDVEAIYANNSKTREKLGWKPKYNLNDMMLTAWQWNNTLSERKQD